MDERAEVQTVGYRRQADDRARDPNSCMTTSTAFNTDPSGALVPSQLADGHGRRSRYEGGVHDDAVQFGDGAAARTGRSRKVLSAAGARPHVT